MKGDSEQSDTIMGGVSFTLQFEAFPLSHRQQAPVELCPRDELPQPLSHPLGCSFSLGYLRLLQGPLPLAYPLQHRAHWALETQLNSAKARPLTAQL